MRSLLIAIALTACGGPAAPPAAPAPPTPPPAAVAPQIVQLAGAGNALWWDATSSTLYLTDSNADALIQWTDRGGLQTVGALPQATGGVGLGGIVRRPDGTTLVASFGFGKQGTLFAMDARGASTALTGLEPTRLRIGLAQDSGGAIYTCYFTGGKGAQAGGVASVAITGGAASETEIAGASTTAGFKKLVGIVATPAAVYVADQSQKTIFKIAVPGFAVTPLAEVPAADLLAILPGGDLLTGGGPAISRIAPDGTVTALPTPAGIRFEQVHGLAYDAAGHRLFVIDHSKTVGVTDKLVILSLAN